MADEFEIMPEKEISDLKKELKEIKQNPLGDNEQSSKLYKTMDNLNESMSNMLNLFKIAADGMKAEEQEELFLAEKIKPLFSKVDQVIEQNEKIAKALVAIADMIDELKNNKVVNPVDELRSAAGLPQQNFQQPSFNPNMNPQYNPQQPQQPQRFSAPQQQSMKQPSFGSDLGPLPEDLGLNSGSEEGIPGPFLDDSKDLPSFSDFSGNNPKMGMPKPPVQDTDHGFSMSHVPETQQSGMNFGGNSVPPHFDSKPPEKKGLFGLKK
ncbi:hypothetical protein JXM83_00785 [Candidatus Woesearchaeota archaeon]|nr:hypothetical protein [Candidatus Woesearchaeota archaeon]